MAHTRRGGAARFPPTRAIIAIASSAPVRWVNRPPAARSHGLPHPRPLEALDQGRDVAPAGSKRRALLALLLLHANETLTTDRLVDLLWGEHPPAFVKRSV